MVRKGRHRRLAGEHGTASVELIAVLPALIIAILVSVQITLAGHALWSASVAARAGARAQVVGEGAEPRALKALPGPMRETAEVDAAKGVAVEVQIPRLVPLMPPLAVTAKTDLGSGDD